ncbi:MAG: hypothetical protein HZB79_10270 [Deltaproteobacteria bacterium]|nr:hypothetical protein [Deltaproteobacteria bacterium]
MRLALSLLLITSIILLIPIQSTAGEIEQRLKSIENENRQLKEVIQELQQRLDAIEKKSLDKPEKQTQKTLDERINALEKKTTEAWLPSLKGEKIKIGGELEFEYRDVQNEKGHAAGSTGSPYGQFQIDKFELYLEAKLQEDVTLYTEIKTDPDETKLDEAHITFSALPLDSYLRLGLQDRFIKPSRKTETYPIAGTAFWRDKDIGMIIGGEIKPFYYRLSVSNGLRLSTKEIGEDASFKIIQDDDDNKDYNNSKEFGIGIGYKDKFMKDHKIDLLLFSYLSSLSDADISFLKTNLPGYTSNKDTNTMFGGTLEYRFKEFSLFSQYIYSEDGSLERHAWYIQPSYKFKIEGIRYLQAVEPLYRHEDYNVNHPPSASKSVTWDRERNTFAFIIDLVDNLKIKLEYNINDEDTGGADVKNNEFIGQVEVKF